MSGRRTLSCSNSIEEFVPPLQLRISQEVEALVISKKEVNAAAYRNELSLYSDLRPIAYYVLDRPRFLSLRYKLIVQRKFRIELKCVRWNEARFSLMLSKRLEACACSSRDSQCWQARLPKIKCATDTNTPSLKRQSNAEGQNSQTGLQYTLR